MDARQVVNKNEENQSRDRNEAFNKMKYKEEIKTEDDFIEKVISDWDSAFAKKYEQKELLRIIFKRLKQNGTNKM